MFPSLSHRIGRGLTATVAATGLVAATMSLVAGSAAIQSSPAEAAAPAPTEAPAEVVGEPCAPGAGVTVVVDFLKAGAVPNDPATDRVEIGCAPGEQADGFAALGNAGFVTGSGSGAGTVCTLNGLPAAGFPYCWYEGYWSYWRSDGTAAWDYAQTGAGGTGVIPVDSVEGWSFTLITDDWESFPPRVAVADLDDLGSPVTATPRAPVLSTIAADETLRFTGPAGSGLEHAVLGEGDILTDAQWQAGRTLALAAYVDSDIRVVARVPGHRDPTFDATYRVRDTYSPGRGLGTETNPDVSVPADDDRIKGWATGWKDYRPGPNVSESWQTPEKALGSPDSGLVVLGDLGELTLTFDKPLADGPGADLAVWENGFRVNGRSLDFLELARVAVSSNGTDFAVFDSASQRTTPVGSYEGQSAAQIGGLAGRDLAGQGTPFDLAALRNHDLVRSGELDLARVSDVKLIDVVGDGSELDSFGRPIYDPFPSFGSGGFDLTAVAVLNQAAETVTEPPGPETPGPVTAEPTTPSTGVTPNPTTPVPTTGPAAAKQPVTVRARVAKKKVQRKQHAVVTIRVTDAQGAPVTGRLDVTLRGRSRTITLTGRQARLRINVGAKPGPAKVRVRYRGDDTHTGARTTVPLRVVR